MCIRDRTKPVLYVANVDEDVVSEPDSIDYVKQIREFAATENAEVVVISARAEEEISELDDEDKQEFLEALGLTESGVDKLTREAYHLSVIHIFEPATVRLDGECSIQLSYET